MERWLSGQTPLTGFQRALAASAAAAAARASARGRVAALSVIGQFREHVSLSVAGEAFLSLHQEDKERVRGMVLEAAVHYGDISHPRVVEDVAHKFKMDVEDACMAVRWTLQEDGEFERMLQRRRLTRVEQQGAMTVFFHGDGHVAVYGARSWVCMNCTFARRGDVGQSVICTVGEANIHCGSVHVGIMGGWGRRS